MNNTRIDGGLHHKFVGVDGEGVTIEGRHTYTMLTAANAVGDTWTIRNDAGLSSVSCLEFLFRVKAESGGVLCGFSFQYDINMILGDIHKLDRAVLAEYDCGYIKAGHLTYKVRIYPHKWYDISRGTWKAGRFIPECSFRIYDVFGFFQSSFVHALRDWKIEGDIDAIEDMKAQRGVFEVAHGDDIAHYNASECVLLARLLEKLDDTFYSAGVRLRSYHGAGAAASALLSAHDIGLFAMDHPSEVDEPIMSAYFGGRIQCIQQGWWREGEEDIYAHDINSAYPAAMPSLPTLDGDWRQIDHWEHTEFAIWRCRWRLPADSNITPFPYRDRGRIYYPTEGEGWYWSVEVDEALKHFAIEIVEGWVYTPKDDYKPFAFVADLYNTRMAYKQAGDMRHVALKLALNSLYGKTAQQVGFRGQRPKFQSFIWAGLITATCRARLLELCMRKPEAVIGIATDGILATAQLDVGKSTILGGWGVEQYVSAFVFGPGRYYLTDRDGVTTTKTRGFLKSEVPRELLLPAWWDDRYWARIQIDSTRFIGYKVATKRKDWNIWRQWIRSERELRATQLPRAVPENIKEFPGLHMRWLGYPFRGRSEPYKRATAWKEQDKGEDIAE